jgi:hypothetical protein
MTAGRGVIHSEMPEQTEGVMEGFQLWLNLPRATRCARPGTATSRAPRSPSGSGPGVTVRVIAGRSHGVAGAMQRDGTEPLYLDLHLEPAPLRAAAAAGPQRLRLRLPRRARHRRQRVPASAWRSWPTHRRARRGSDGVRCRPPGRRARAALLIAGRPLRRADRAVRPVRDEHAPQEIFTDRRWRTSGRGGWPVGHRHKVCRHRDRRR